MVVEDNRIDTETSNCLDGSINRPRDRVGASALNARQIYQEHGKYLNTHIVVLIQLIISLCIQQSVVYTLQSLFNCSIIHALNKLTILPILN